MLLRRTVKAFLQAKAGFNGKAIEVVSNVAGAVTVTCKANVFTLVSLQAWLKDTLALVGSPLAGQTLVWLPCSGKADSTLAKFTCDILKGSELGVQHNSTYAMSAQRVLDEQAKAEAEAQALAAMSAGQQEQAPAPEQAPEQPVRSRRGRRIQA